jgi:hypothetical protein
MQTLQELFHGDPRSFVDARWPECLQSRQRLPFELNEICISICGI